MNEPQRKPQRGQSALTPRGRIPPGLEAPVPVGWTPSHGTVPPGWERAFGGDLHAGSEFVLEVPLVDAQGLHAGYGFGGRLFRMTGSSQAASGNRKVWVFGHQPVYVRSRPGHRAFAPVAGTLLGAGITAAVASIPAGFGWTYGAGWASEVVDQHIRSSAFGPPGKLPSEASRGQGARGKAAGRADLSIARGEHAGLHRAVTAALAPHAGRSWRGVPIVTFGVHPPTGEVYVSTKTTLTPSVRSAVQRAASVYGYRLTDARTLGAWSAFVLEDGHPRGAIMDRGRAAAPRGRARERIKR